MKISVYAISKNESKFVESWVKSVEEADEIVVLDTGSSDDTVKKLREAGVKVYEEKIDPWRFDVARNRSLELVSEDTDVCVCVDLDERFEKGWREKLEKAYEKDVQQYKYRYTWSFNADGSEGVVFWQEKIHSRKGFCWEHPVHEVPKYIGKEPYKSKFAEGIQLNHYPDHTKSRSNYLPLLELSVKECPDDDRNMHYLGREYMFHKMYDDSIRTLKKHLQMPQAVWRDERCASMRYIAKCLIQKNMTDRAEGWLLRAVAEAPRLREPYVDLALLYYNKKNWHGVILMCEKALEIKDRSLSYINEPSSWGSLPYDILSLAYYYTGNCEKALEYVDKAIELSDEPRLKDNKTFFIKKLKTA